MGRGAIATGLVTIAVIQAAALTASASADLVWEDRFDRVSGPLGSPWIDPGGTYQVDQASGRAYAATRFAFAWRDTGSTDHEIEVTPYKLTDGGQGDSVGGVTVGQTDGDNFVGYELVKTTPTFINGPESKSVLYLRVGGQETVVVEVPHPELTIDQTVDLRLRKVGRVVEAYLDDVLDANYTLNDAQAEALDGTHAGFVNFAGPNNYYEARAFDVASPPPSTPTTTSALTGTTAPAPAATATAAATSSAPLAQTDGSHRTFLDASGDLRAGADLRRLTVATGKRILITSTHRNLSRTADVRVRLYLDTTASRVGPEYLLRTAIGRRGDGWSVRQLNTWQTAGTQVRCPSTRTVDYTSEKVIFSLAPACLGRGHRLRVAAVVTASGLRDWAPSYRRSFFSWMSR